MFKTKLAGAAAVVVCLTAGVANAQSTTFPSSPNEATPFSFSYDSMRDVRSGATDQPAPSMPSEASAHSVPAPERSVVADRLSRTYGSVFPSSPNESGSM